jgi:predicted nucleic acid-binding protein
VLYLDSSALIKHYLLERGRWRLEARLKQETDAGAPIFSSVLTYAEIHAVLARKNRDDERSESEAAKIHDQFDGDWILTLSPVEISSGVLGFVRDIVKVSPLRGADTLHLASALWLRDMTRIGLKPGGRSGSLTFVSSNKQLLAAAEKQKIQVFNPETN